MNLFLLFMRLLLTHPKAFPFSFIIGFVYFFFSQYFTFPFSVIIGLGDAFTLTKLAS